mmetsp:Transcript_15544/g.58948  ORF Transcript_15544/g.58948 Transcript_15544/m.58948 type:complete len:284 (-) Transcript_15544:703-1554(-)
MHGAPCSARSGVDELERQHGRGARARLPGLARGAPAPCHSHGRLSGVLQVEERRGGVEREPDEGHAVAHDAVDRVRLGPEAGGVHVAALEPAADDARLCGADEAGSELRREGRHAVRVQHPVAGLAWRRVPHHLHGGAPLPRLLLLHLQRPRHARRQRVDEPPGAALREARQGAAAVVVRAHRVGRVDRLAECVQVQRNGKIAGGDKRLDALRLALGGGGGPVVRLVADVPVELVRRVPAYGVVPVQIDAVRGAVASSVTLRLRIIKVLILAQHGALQRRDDR